MHTRGRRTVPDEPGCGFFSRVPSNQQMVERTAHQSGGARRVHQRAKAGVGFI
jgi:hypothetical protein